MNKADADQPTFDEYLFCDECFCFVYEYCSIHGPLLNVPDNRDRFLSDDLLSKPRLPQFIIEVLIEVFGSRALLARKNSQSQPRHLSKIPRAALTIPSAFLHIAASSVSGAGLGVFSSRTLPRGVRFGPYKGSITDRVASTYCWQIQNGKNPSRVILDASNADSSNWLRYVNCARHWHEQNLLAFQYKGHIYYRTIKTIRRFTELLVFYGSEYAAELKIDLGKYNSNEGTSCLSVEHNTNFSGNNEAFADKKKYICHNNNNYIGAKQLHDEIFIECKRIEMKFNNSAINATPKDIVQSGSLYNGVDTRKYTCLDCKSRYKKKWSLKRHLLKNCCTTGPSTKSKMVNRSREGEIIRDKYVCNNCNKEFAKRRYLVKHIKIHDKASINTFTKECIGNKLQGFSCDECNFRTSKSLDGSYHKKFHDKTRMFYCEICSYRFKTKKNLTKHVKIHFSKRIN